MKEEFVRLLEESVLIQGSITLIMVITISVMYITQKTVPDPLVNFVALILGYYFGSKTKFRGG